MTVHARTGYPARAKMPIDKDLLEILACPACRTPVIYEVRDGEWLVCTACARRYPIRDGIPVMLLEEAQTGAPKASP